MTAPIPPAPAVPTRRPAPAWRRVVAVLAALAWLLALGAARPAQALHEAPAATMLELDRALFSRHAREAGEPVALPDTWVARGLDNQGSGVYRLTFELPRVPEELWALCLSRLSDFHEVRLNGALIAGSPLDGADRAHGGGSPSMVWIPVPPRLLVVGTNRLDIAVAHASRGGLSGAVIGSAHAMRPGYELAEHLHVTLPVWLNIAGIALALFMLMIWYRRRSERLLGGFGVLWVLIALSSILHLTSSWTHRTSVESLLFVAQVAVVALICMTALALAQQRETVLGGVVPLSALVLGAVGLWGGISGTLDEVRRWSYPLMLAGVMLSLWRLRGETRRLRPAQRRILLAAVALACVAAVHDYGHWRGLTSVMDLYWLPLALPVTLIVVGSVLVKRLVHALHQVEQLNADLERRVVERTEALQQANLAKTRFLTAASHDLRQPVVTIGLLIDLLRERVPAALRPMTEQVNDAVSSMEDLLRGLLDLSRLEAGTVRPRLQAIAMQPLFDAIAAHEAEAARRKGISLRFRPSRESVVSDPVMLEQMLRNLVSNAVRYTERGGVLVGVRRRGPREIQVEVWDTGIGIPAEQQRSVFDEFVQIDRRDGRPVGRETRSLGDGGRGLGLGLSIVQRSAALLGHRISLRSRLDHGSCFAIRVPRARPVPTATPTSEERGQPLRGLRLTVVEDEPSVQSALRARLEAWGAVVHCHEGLAPLRRRLALRPRGHSGIDLLITDHRLRGATGLEVIDAVRRYAGPVPVLVITGDTAPDDLALMAATGLQVLHKPFRADALLDSIRASMVRPDAPDAPPAA